MKAKPVESVKGLEAHRGSGQDPGEEGNQHRFQDRNQVGTDVGTQKPGPVEVVKEVEELPVLNSFEHDIDEAARKVDPNAPRYDSEEDDTDDREHARSPPDEVGPIEASRRESVLNVIFRMQDLAKAAGFDTKVKLELGTMGTSEFFRASVEVLPGGEA